MAEMFAQAEWECSTARERETIYPAAAGCFRRIPPGYQEAGLSFPEGAGAFSCLQLVLLWRAAECRLVFFESTILSNVVGVRQFLCFWALHWNIHYQPGHQGVGKGSNCAFRGDPVSLSLSRSDCAVFESSREWLWDTVNGVTYTRNCFYIFWWGGFPCVWI